MNPTISDLEEIEADENNSKARREAARFLLRRTELLGNTADEVLETAQQLSQFEETLEDSPQVKSEIEQIVDELL